MSLTTDIPSIRVARIINELNLKWDLNLPPGGREMASPEAGELATLAGGCVEYLHSLSATLAKPDLERIVEDFEEYARQVFSEWVWKPSQARGSIASLPRTKSLLYRDHISKGRASSGISSKHRLDLLRDLHRRLQDDLQLSLSSDSYQRQSPPSLARARSEMAIEKKTSVVRMNSQKSSSASKSSPNKRASSLLVDLESDKRPKQARIDDMITPYIRDLRSLSTHLPRSSLQSPESFKSGVSQEPSAIFSPPLDASHLPSGETSLFNSDDDCDNKSQDLFPTQDVDEICADPSFRTSFNELDASSHCDDIIKELKQYGPFAGTLTSTLPMNLPFGYRYELHRISMALELPVEDLYRLVRRKCRKAKPSYEEIWSTARSFAKDQKREMPARSSQSAYAAADGNFEDPDSGQSVTLSGHLSWIESGTLGLFRLRLNPLKLEKSCRFHRRFGADRFFVLSIPFFTLGWIPREIRNKRKFSEMTHEDICKWLSLTEHIICGRKWRIFFVDPEKGKKNRVLKLYLFATDGVDFVPRGLRLLPRQDWQTGGKHIPMGVDQLIEWHLRPQLETHLERSTDFKLFSRFALGLSKTTATITLEPSAFLELDDPPADKPVMNDGCAMMSLKLAKLIAEKLGLNDDECPTAFQGRISGAKGLWTVDYHNSHPGVGKDGIWIEVSNSQLKIQPHPRQCGEADKEQRTFEVLKYSTKAKPASLNAQFLNILDHHNVDAGILKDVLLAEIRKYTMPLIDAIKDPMKLAGWLFEHHRPRRGKGPIEYQGCLPKSHEEQVMLFLESGFKPGECEILAERLKFFVETMLDNYIERRRIRVDSSTSLFCVADPYGVLEEGEVYIGLSSRRQNPKTGIMEPGIFGVDVLVGRNPANLPSDIQRVKAVFRPELRNFQDVILFSIKGSRPLASLLSGGDYDGDTVFVCWEPSLVQSFQNSPPPEQPPSVSECGLEEVAKELSSIFSGPPKCFSTEEFKHQSDEFLYRCVWFNSQPSLLGQCTTDHEKVIYHRKAKLSSPEAIKLATLANYLVDANKQGYYLSERKYSSLRNQITGIFHLSEPAYKTDEGPLRTDGVYDGYTNLMDWLKFCVAKNEKERVLTLFYASHSQGHSYDSQLSHPWKTVYNRAEQEFKKSKRSDLKIVLEQMQKDVREIGRKWTEKTSSIGRNGSRIEDGENSWLAPIVDELYSEFCDIKPLAGISHELVDRYYEEKDLEHSYWARLRASCLYFHYHKGKAAWNMAGKHLCKIKAEACGSIRVLTSPMHNLLKVDQKMIERITADAQAEEDGCDLFTVGDDEEDVAESWMD